MIEMLATKLLIDFLESQDKVDSIGHIKGTHSVEWLDAFEEHMERRQELHRLLVIGLAHDL